MLASWSFEVAGSNLVPIHMLVVDQWGEAAHVRSD